MPNTAQITRAAIGFAAVVLAYGAYSMLAVPWIEPVAAERPVETTDSDGHRIASRSRHTALLESLYPDESHWQRRRPKIIETDQAVLLLKDYRTLEDGRMELKPCTLLFIDPAKAPRADGHPGRVVVLDAPEGAVLQFDNELDLRRAEFGKLVGGRLVGDVTIRSNESEPGAGDRIYLATRNVNMDQQRVWTPSDVELRFGQSYGRGRDLIMTFLPAEEGASGHGPNIGGVKSLELVHLERLHLVGESNVFDDSPATSSQQANAAPVEITCQGPLLLDLENSVATFEEDVDVIRLNDSGPSDQLNCRLLEIYFDGIASNQLPAAPRSEVSAPSPKHKATINKVVALGYPVVLRSPSMGASARGERLELDLLNREVRLDGEQSVMLQHQDRRIDAMSVRYQLPQQGKIGAALAKGPGRLRAALPGEAPNDPPRMITAKWQDRLSLQPDGNGHVLSLLGEAQVGDVQFGGLAAREIYLWLKETASSSGRGAADEANPNIQPDRLLAKGEVKLDSPSLTGNTEQFEVWFQHVPEKALAENQTPDRRQDFPRQPRRDAATPANRFDISGKLLRILLATTGKDVQLRDVSIAGDARIRETQTALPNEKPVEIAGDFVHVSAADSPAAKAVVAGKPALVSGRGVTLKGGSVHLDRAANRIWVPGQGQATLPMAGLGDSQDSRLSLRERQALAERTPTNPKFATVTWNDGMQFDGRTVQLRGNVVANTDAQRLGAPAVDITLTQPVDLQNPSRSTAIDVQTVHLQGQVSMASRTVENGQVASVEEMMVRDLTIDQQSGAITGVGPGWMKTVRRGAQLATPQLGRATLASTGAQAQSDDSLTYLRVTFQTGMSGNVHQRYVELQDDIRAVYGPVQGWNDVIDPDRALESQGDVVMLTSDRLQIAETSGSQTQPAVELTALGNATVEGQTFTARAHRIAYAQAKDMLVIEGDGRTDAELYRQASVGGQTARAAARKILYWPSSGRMDVDTFTSLDWEGTLPSAGGQTGSLRGSRSPLPSGVGEYLRRERENRPQHSSTAPR